MTPIERFYRSFIEKELNDQSYHNEEYTDAMLLLAKDYSGKEKEIDTFEKKLKEAVAECIPDRDTEWEDKELCDKIPELRAKASCPELEAYLDAEWKDGNTERALRVSRLVKEGKIKLELDEYEGASYNGGELAFDISKMEKYDLDVVDIELNNSIIPLLIEGYDAFEENESLISDETFWDNGEASYLTYEKNKGFMLNSVRLTGEMKDNLNGVLTDFIGIIETGSLNANEDVQAKVGKLVKQMKKDLKEDKGKEIGD